MAKKSSYKQTSLFSSDFNKGMIFGLIVALILVFIIGQIADNYTAQSLNVPDFQY